MTAVNPNALWAQAFVEELACAGLRHVVIAPGSRSTPLVFAFAGQPEIHVYSQIDERGAGFFALGLANALQQPVALLCTSGTAAAEFYPAIVEAHYSAVPLIVLTADRAHELRESGANQTVDQIKLYGDHVNWFYEVALPEDQPPAIALRNLRTLAHRAYAAAMGQPKGAVHLNFPFRKPLEPTPISRVVVDDTSARANDTSFVTISRGIMQPAARQIEQVNEVIRGAKRGLILCGPRCPRGDFPDAIHRLSLKTGFPVLADALSGVRYRNFANVIGGFETILGINAALQPPDTIIQFGALPTSQSLENYLTGHPPDNWIQVTEDGRWQDPNFLTNEQVWADPVSFADMLTKVPGDPVPNTSQQAWLSNWRASDDLVNRETTGFVNEHWFDGAVLQRVTTFAPENMRLMVGSSLPVRHLDQFGLNADGVTLNAYANRGASGIDGTLASAAGVGAAFPGQPLVVVLGDLSFYHDLNSLLTFIRARVKVTIVVVNNDGGGIFRRLPVSQFEPIFTELFLTPHGLHFEAAARLFGMDYVLAKNQTEFDAAFSGGFENQNSLIIEVPTVSDRDLLLRKQFLEKVKAQFHEARLTELQEDTYDELG
ncbi:MAG: 2-succinyl-5-enolpyruvyl-6-hydroxy-3-cyclohexene-1-carboxylic-acid synthase [Anaerolineae bacterium]|nr:2-succinyl-5-enolpyruvyl-6-hydroxy-3-cyclohexene-1-carboxylic-acid synthase [Anaerolineae bacterium]